MNKKITVSAPTFDKKNIMKFPVMGNPERLAKVITEPANV